MDYDNAGKVAVGGWSKPGATVQLYLDNMLVVLFYDNRTVSGMDALDDYPYDERKIARHRQSYRA